MSDDLVYGEKRATVAGHYAVGRRSRVSLSVMGTRKVAVTSETTRDSESGEDDGTAAQALRGRSNFQVRGI